MTLEKARALAAEYEMLPPGATVVCAVSGGADSVCLLHWLYQLSRLPGGFTLVAAHYDHHLRGEESARDAAFVRRFVSGLSSPDQARREGDGRPPLPPVKLVVGGGDVAAEAKRRGRGIEETAREMRYAFLRQTADALGGALIATAHTADDNVETVLLHLLRGSGLQGLTGIAPRREDLIRPLLTTSREEIEDYLTEYGIPHVEDSTNADDAYTRNRVRHRLVPLMEELSPGFARRLTETIPRLRTDNDYLNAQALPLAGQARWRGDELTLPAAAVAQAPGPIAARCVRQLLARMDGGSRDFAGAHINAVLSLCRGGGPSGEVHLPHGLSARREYDLLVLTRRPPLPPLTPTPLSFQGLTTPENSLWRVFCARGRCPQAPVEGVWYLSLDALGPDALLRPRREGDAVTLPGRERRTLKKLFIDRKIPRLQRENIPVLTSQGRLAAVAGLGCEVSCLARPGEAAWCLTFLPLEDEGAEGAAPLGGDGLKSDLEGGLERGLKSDLEGGLEHGPGPGAGPGEI